MSSSSRQILADNLQRLMKSRRELSTTPQLEAATARHTGGNGRVTKSTIDRVLKTQTPFNLDDLESIAKVFGLQSWQLLVEDLDPKNPPMLASIGSAQARLLEQLTSIAQEVAALSSAAGNPLVNSKRRVNE